MIRPLSLLLALSACKDSPSTDDSVTPEPWRPDVKVCPGDAGCETNDGPLRAGASKLIITPPCFESWTDLDGDAEKDRDEEFLDCGCDRLCPGDEGYTAPDEGEGDGDFQAIWIAGFQNNRPAAGVHDELWARAVAFEQGDTTVAIVEVDLVGWFYDPHILATRELLYSEGVLDHLIVASTHNHEGPDTMGIWGETETRTGFDETYGAFVRDQIAESVRLAVADLREVGTFKVGSVDTSAVREEGVLNLLQDKRDPKVVDVQLGAALLQDTSGQTIATLAHFGNHPEALADENDQITSDFPNTLRTGLEDGVTYDSYQREGYGGVAIFLNGAVGGMMTPLGITVTDGEGVERREYSFEKNDALGKVKAELAMDAIEGGETVTDAQLTLAAHSFYLPVDNWGFQAMFLTQILNRPTYNWDESQSIGEGNTPQVLTEMDLLKLGPLEILTIPGEPLPELAIGGYDGSAVGTTLHEVVDAENPNPPDLSQAPAGPYYKDQMTGTYKWVLGMGNDELGYFVPEYDFQLDERNPWFDEPEGDHYEETNSLGPRTAGLLDAELAQLSGWVAENQR